MLGRRPERPPPRCQGLKRPLGVTVEAEGEASHPGPLQVSCLNTRGDQGAWDVLRLSEPTDVWLLQETWFNDDKAAAYKRFAHSKGFIAYVQNGPTGARGQHPSSGGVAVLVRRGLSQKFGAQFNTEDCQGIFVWVQGLFIGSVYAPPHEHCPQAVCSGLLDSLVSANLNSSHK